MYMHTYIYMYAHIYVFTCSARNCDAYPSFERMLLSWGYRVVVSELAALVGRHDGSKARSLFSRALEVMFSPELYLYTHTYSYDICICIYKHIVYIHMCIHVTYVHI